jgi:hypothetical protein
VAITSESSLTCQQKNPKSERETAYFFVENESWVEGNVLLLLVLEKVKNGQQKGRSALAILRASRTPGDSNVNKVLSQFEVRKAYCGCVTAVT